MILPLNNEIKVTEKMVQQAFFDQFRSQFTALIQNTFLLGWEADILALDSSLIPHEYEIKLSVADLKNDAKKSRLKNANLEEQEYEVSHKYEHVQSGKGASSLTYLIPNSMVEKAEIPEAFGITSFETILVDEDIRWTFSSIRNPKIFHINPTELETLIKLLANLADHRFSETMRSSDELVEQKYAELKRKYQRIKRKYEAELESKDFVTQWNLDFDNDLQHQLDVISEILLSKKGLLSESELEKLKSSGFIGF